MSGLGRVARGAMVKCWLWRAGSRRLSRPKAEATGLAPKQAADRHYPLASPSEGFVLVSSPILAGCAGSRSSSSEGSVLAPSPIPAGRAVSCQQVPAMASRAHPLRLTLRSSAVFPFGLLTAAGAFVRRIASVKSRSCEKDCFGEVSELRPWAQTTRRSPGAVYPALPRKFWSSRNG